MEADEEADFFLEEEDLGCGGGEEEEEELAKVSRRLSCYIIWRDGGVGRKTEKERKRNKGEEELVEETVNRGQNCWDLPSCGRSDVWSLWSGKGVTSCGDGGDSVYYD